MGQLEASGSRASCRRRRTQRRRPYAVPVNNRAIPSRLVFASATSRCSQRHCVSHQTIRKNIDGCPTRRRRLDGIDQNQGADIKPSTDQRRTAYYRADVQGLNPGDAATRTLDPLDGEEYTYATTRLDVARLIAERHSDFSVYRVILHEPIEADPGATRDNLGELFVRSPWGAVADIVDEKEE
jgi:hypothetical protein